LWTRVFGEERSIDVCKECCLTFELTRARKPPQAAVAMWVQRTVRPRVRGRRLQRCARLDQ
jgi:hypothetical protein